MLSRMALRAGDRRVAWKALRRAAQLRPVASEVLAEIVDGFTALGMDREARLLSENALRFNLVTTLMRSQLKTINNAIQEKSG